MIQCKFHNALTFFRLISVQVPQRTRKRVALLSGYVTGEKIFEFETNQNILYLCVALFLRGVYVSFLVLKPNRRGVPQDDEGEPTERQ